MNADERGYRAMLSVAIVLAAHLTAFAGLIPAAQAAPADGHDVGFTPVPWVSVPQPPPGDTLVPWPQASWLPPAVLPERQRLAPAVEFPGVRLRPALDLPTPATLADRVPAVVLQPAAPLVRAPSADLSRMPLRPLSTAADPGRASLTADPAAGPSRQAASAADFGLRQTAAPFLRLAIPDPFEPIQAMPLRPVPDDDAPRTAPPPPVKP